jgi:hypothetical protein
MNRHLHRLVEFRDYRSCLLSQLLLHRQHRQPHCQKIRLLHRQIR